MKKFLSLIAIATIATPCSSFMSAWNTSKTNINYQTISKHKHRYSPWILSSWGTKQKAQISASYMASAKEWYQIDHTWYQWMGDESFALQDAFSVINPNINIWTDLTWSYSTVSGQTNLKQALAKGVTLTAQGVQYSDFKGKITLQFKGSI